MNSFTMLSSNKQSSSAALHPVPYEGNWIDIREYMASISTSIFKQDDLGENLQTHMHSLACMYLLASFSTRFLLLLISSTTFCHIGVHFSIIIFLHAIPHPLNTRFFGVSVWFLYIYSTCAFPWIHGFYSMPSDYSFKISLAINCRIKLMIL